MFFSLPCLPSTPFHIPLLFQIHGLFYCYCMSYGTALPPHPLPLLLVLCRAEVPGLFRPHPVGISIGVTLVQLTLGRHDGWTTLDNPTTRPLYLHILGGKVSGYQLNAR